MGVSFAGQRRGYPLYFDLLPRRNQDSQRLWRLLPCEYGSCASANLNGFHEQGDTQSPHGCRYTLGLVARDAL